MISRDTWAGLMMIAGGMVFSMFGFMLFMNGTLIGTGNILVIVGTILFVGHKRTAEFLFRSAPKSDVRGSKTWRVEGL